MATLQKTDRLAEDARRAQEAFDRHVRPNLREEDDGKFVAIDLTSGNYEIDADDFQATEKLLARVPSAQVWLQRAGQATTYRIGRRSAEFEK